jgi:hypothetical protein
MTLIIAPQIDSCLTFPRDRSPMCPSLPERLLLLLIDRPRNGESLGAVYGYHPLVVARRLPYSAGAYAFPLSALSPHQASTI